MNWKQYDFRYEINGKSGVHVVYAMDLPSAYTAARKTLGNDAKIEYPMLKPMPANVTRGGRRV